jgi:hypothetical protein
MWCVQEGKIHPLPFSLSTCVTHFPVEIIYSDVWGPTQNSINENYVYVSFVDAYSRFKHKCDIYDMFL